MMGPFGNFIPPAPSALAIPIASTQPLAASQGFPWYDAVQTNRVRLAIHDRLPKVSLQKMNTQMKGYRDSMFAPSVPGNLPRPQRPLLDTPFRDITDVAGWQGYISNHKEMAFIAGPGVVWAGWVAFLDEDDPNHHANVVDLLLVCSDGALVRMHPREGRTPVGIRIGRFDGYFTRFVKYDWSDSRIRPPSGIGLDLSRWPP